MASLWNFISDFKLNSLWTIFPTPSTYEGEVNILI